MAKPFDLLTKPVFWKLLHAKWKTGYRCTGFKKSYHGHCHLEQLLLSVSQIKFTHFSFLIIKTWRISDWHEWTNVKHWEQREEQKETETMGDTRTPESHTVRHSCQCFVGGFFLLWQKYLGNFCSFLNLLTLVVNCLFSLSSLLFQTCVCVSQKVQTG